jgi:hypothetical protein
MPINRVEQGLHGMDENLSIQLRRKHHTSPLQPLSPAFYVEPEENLVLVGSVARGRPARCCSRSRNQVSIKASFGRPYLDTFAPGAMQKLPCLVLERDHQC